VAREQGISVIYANDAHVSEIDREFKLWGHMPLRVQKVLR